MTHLLDAPSGINFARASGRCFPNVFPPLHIVLLILLCLHCGAGGRMEFSTVQLPLQRYHLQGETPSTHLDWCVVQLQTNHTYIGASRSQDTLDILCILLSAPFRRSSLTITCQYDVEFSPHVVAYILFPSVQCKHIWID